MKKLTEMIIKNPLRKPCILFAAVLLIFSAGLCACGAKKESKTEISIENENISIHAENSTLKLDLIGNSSTGYEWTVEVENEDLLSPYRKACRKVDICGRFTDSAFLVEYSYCFSHCFSLLML